MSQSSSALAFYPPELLPSVAVCLSHAVVPL